MTGQDPPRHHGEKEPGRAPHPPCKQRALERGTTPGRCQPPLHTPTRLPKAITTRRCSWCPGPGWGQEGGRRSPPDGLSSAALHTHESTASAFAEAGPVSDNLPLTSPLAHLEFQPVNHRRIVLHRDPPSPARYPSSRLMLSGPRRGPSSGSSESCARAAPPSLAGAQAPCGGERSRTRRRRGGDGTGRNEMEWNEMGRSEGRLGGRMVTRVALELCQEEAMREAGPTPAAGCPGQGPAVAPEAAPSPARGCGGSPAAPPPWHAPFA